MFENKQILNALISVKSNSNEWYSLALFWKAKNLWLNYVTKNYYVSTITYFVTPSKKGYVSLIVNNTTCCSEVWLSIAFVVLPQPTLPLFASFQTFLPESWPASAAYVRHFVPTKLLFRHRKYQSKTWIWIKSCLNIKLQFHASFHILCEKQYPRRSIWNKIWLYQSFENIYVHEIIFIQKFWF